MRPTREKVMVRYLAESTQRGGMICTLISEILRVAVHVLHGNS